MGMNDGGSIQYGYDFEILNTFEIGLLKKTVFTHPVQDGSESDPLGLEGRMRTKPRTTLELEGSGRGAITIRNTSMEVPPHPHPHHTSRG